MRIQRFTRPSDEQVKKHGKDAKAHMMDQHVIHHAEHGIRLTGIDCAPVPGDPWFSTPTAQARDVPDDTPFNGGVVAATALWKAMLGMSMNRTGVGMIDQLNEAINRVSLIKYCARTQDDMAQVIRANRNAWPTGYVGDVVILLGNDDDVIIHVTGVGDVYVALNTDGCPIEVIRGNLEPRPYNGEVIMGREKEIDLFKAELRQMARDYLAGRAADYPNWSEKDRNQFAHSLIYWERSRLQEFASGLPNRKSMEHKLLEVIRTYALQNYPTLTGEVFDAMIAEGMNAWQQNQAQNNPKAGPFWYPALDGGCDTPEEGITHYAIRLLDVCKHRPRIVLWTDGSKPTSSTGITIESLAGVNAFGECTELELILDSSPGYEIVDVQK